MTERVLSLPDTEFSSNNKNPLLQAPFDIILKTMKNWCGKDQEEGGIKGLVIFGYSLDQHLKFLKYREDILKNYLYDKTYADFQETVTVYNPQKRVVFLIRRARDKKDLEHEMKSSIDDILKFVFLYNDILKNSGIKVINLLITNADVECCRWKCKFCKHQAISLDSLASCDLFEKWLEKEKCNFETDYDPSNKGNTFSFDFSAKVLGFLASFQFSRENPFQWSLPSLTDNPARQMEETTILLTLEQLRIVNSTNKHLMIKGCYGSGKSLVALKKAEMTSKILRQNEILCFISYDSSSMLTVDIESTSSKIKLYRNEGALKLSDIINNIKKDHPQNKINLFIDEYDSEQLDESEATKLNEIFTTDENFRDSIVCLVFEALERERIVNGVKQIANLLPLLKSVELKELTFNKRNTLQIHKVVKLTTDVLNKQTTVVIVPICIAKDSQLQSGLEKTLKEENENDTDDQFLTVQYTGKQKFEDNNGGENLNKNKKIIFDEACKYFRLPIYTSIASNEVTTKFRHRESKHSGHSIESGKPNLYEIYYPKASTEFILSLMVVLEQIFINDYNEIKKHVILHFDVEKNIPNIFHMAFKLMGILEKVTNRYEEFKKGNSKKIFISSFRAFRGLEYPRLVVVLDRNLCGLEHYLPECLNRCTTYLHGIFINEDINMLKQTRHLQKIITAWKKQYNNNTPINYYKVHIFGSCSSKTIEKFYEIRRMKNELGVIKINSASRKYKELEANFGKFEVPQNENEGKITQEELEFAVAR